MQPRPNQPRRLLAIPTLPLTLRNTLSLAVVVIPVVHVVVLRLDVEDRADLDVEAEAAEDGVHSEVDSLQGVGEMWEVGFCGVRVGVAAEEAEYAA